MTLKLYVKQNVYKKKSKKRRKPLYENRPTCTLPKEVPNGHLPLQVLVDLLNNETSS